MHSKDLPQEVKKECAIDRFLHCSQRKLKAIVPPVEKFGWNKVSLSIQLPEGKKFVEKQLIQNLSGCVMAGELVGIMGGSGAGKTTLLNTLASRIGPGKLTGKHQLCIQSKLFIRFGSNFYR
jgi:ABC-type glutathione transport system ATPase component